MRALAGAARREATADPVSVLLLMTALAAVHLAPAFQFHRLGEPGRLARDGGLSALLVFGGCFAAAAAMRTVGREIATGVAAAALVRPVTRAAFLAAKAAGVVVALARFALAVYCAAAVSAMSCVVGSRLVGDDGTACVSSWGLLFGFGGEIAAIVLAALVHRFRRRGFVSTCFTLLVWSQLAALALMLAIPPFRVEAGPALLLPLAGAAVAVLSAVTAFSCAAAALSSRLKAASAASAVGVLAVCSLLLPAMVRVFPPFAALRTMVPDFGVFWLADSLVSTMSFPWGAMAAASAASIAAGTCWLAVGALLFSNRDVN